MVDASASFMKDGPKNLNLPRYIDSQIPEDIQDIEGRLQSGIPAADVDALDRYWAICPGLKATLFKKNRKSFRPKVVVIEFNPAFPPPQKAVVQFHPLNYWEEGSNYYGASIQSLYELGKQKGYELVHCTSAGINLFFVDAKDFARLGIRDNSPATLYRAGLPGMPKPGPGPGGGHRSWDTYEIEQDGVRVKPFAGDLIWKEVHIPKKFVALP